MAIGTPTAGPNSARLPSSSSAGHSGIFDSAKRSMVSSRRVLPCIIQSSSAATAESTLLEPRACMVMRLLRRWAASDMAFISSGEKASKSPRRLSPILIRSTPFLTWWRISVTISSVVLARTPMLDSGTPTDDGYQSLMPLLVVMNRPAVVILGPWIRPSAMPSRMPTPMK